MLRNSRDNIKHFGKTLPAHHHCGYRYSSLSVTSPQIHLLSEKRMQKKMSNTPPLLLIASQSASTLDQDDSQLSRFYSGHSRDVLRVWIYHLVWEQSLACSSALQPKWGITEIQTTSNFRPSERRCVGAHGLFVCSWICLSPFKWVYQVTYNFPPGTRDRQQIF